MTKHVYIIHRAYSFSYANWRAPTAFGGRGLVTMEVLCRADPV
jgi:hypothetical protein